MTLHEETQITMQPAMHKLSGILTNSISLTRFRRFFRLLVSRFIEDQGLLQASSLTYTTLLSIVPLMTVSLAILSAFPVSERIADEIQSFIFENFMPSSGDVLRSYFEDFSTKASRLSGVGFAFLIIVALMLMENIDHALNKIWRTSATRGALSKFLEYWAILTLGPILIGTSVAATSYLVSMPIFTDAVGTINQGQFLLRLAPLITSAIGFTLIYSIIPNRHVPIRHALAGGLLAALLFELAKRGFAAYLTHFPTYEAIYGALAVIPIFLVWIYLSWMVTLLGAEFSCCLGIFQDEETLAGGDSRSDLLLAFRLTEELWKVQHSGESLSPRELSLRLGYVSEERIENILDELKTNRMVLRSDQRNWVLARNLTEVTLYDLYRLRPFLLPEPDRMLAMDDDSGQLLKEILTHMDEDLTKTMGQSLDSIFSHLATDSSDKSDNTAE